MQMYTHKYFRLPKVSADSIAGALTFLILLSTTIILLSSCGSNHEKKEEEVDFLVTAPLVRDTMLVREYVAQIRAIQHIELRALEKGYLQKTFVDEGQRVQKGQMMFQILPILYQAELQKSEAEARFAQIEYINTKKLADSQVVAPNELAMAAAKYEKAKAELMLAKAHLTFTQIKAPFNGFMDHLNVRLGSLVNEGDLLTRLSDNSKMWVYFNVPEAEYLNYKSVAKSDSLIKVSLLMANNKVFNHNGVVETIEADFNNETGNIEFRATFPNPESLLRHGETGNIRMKIPYDNAMIIPQKATYEVLEKKFVFVVDKNNVVKSKEISIKAELPDLYLVESGLKADDKILLEGIQKVRDNDKIKYHFMEPAKVLPTLKVYTE